jgi:hypothetical protein
MLSCLPFETHDPVVGAVFFFILLLSLAHVLSTVVTAPRERSPSSCAAGQMAVRSMAAKRRTITRTLCAKNTGSNMQTY